MRVAMSDTDENFPIVRTHCITAVNFRLSGPFGRATWAARSSLVYEKISPLVSQARTQFRKTLIPAMEAMPGVYIFVGSAAAAIR